MTVWGTIVLLVGGGGGYTSYELVKDHAIDVGNDHWVTLASQNLDLRFETEDELATIQRKIDRGTATEDDRIRQAVLEERLKRLLIYEASQ